MTPREGGKAAAGHTKRLYYYFCRTLETPEGPEGTRGQEAPGGPEGKHGGTGAGRKAIRTQHLVS